MIPEHLNYKYKVPYVTVTLMLPFTQPFTSLSTPPYVMFYPSTNIWYLQLDCTKSKVSGYLDIANSLQSCLHFVCKQIADSSYILCELVNETSAAVCQLFAEHITNSVTPVIEMSRGSVVICSANIYQPIVDLLLKSIQFMDN